MVRPISILLLTFCAIPSFAQTEVKEIPLEEIKGTFVLYWEINKTSFIGERIRINKRRKFEYSVFSTYPGILTKAAEQTIVKGKYKITSDTLNLAAVTKPCWGAEMFNLKSKYLIRALSVKSEGGERRTLTCLVNLEKVKKLDSIIELMPDTLENYYANTRDFFRKISAIGLETEILFYEENIFIKED